MSRVYDWVGRVYYKYYNIIGNYRRQIAVFDFFKCKND